MNLDRFIDHYIGLLNKEIESGREVLATKNFESLEQFSKAQGHLQGITEALLLLRSIPEDD